MNLSYAARLRQRADWMVGLNATRAYTLTAGRGKMISVGRVQTPTLNLVVERDALVEQFKELYYYSVVGTWKGFQAQNVILSGAPAESKDPDKKSEGLKVAVFEKEAEAIAVVERCKPPAPATIAKIDTQQKKQFPQKPFDLTELQKEGNKRFKFSAQQVLDCAQNLYEKKLLTYPRTDSQYLPDTMKQEAYALAQRLASPEQKGVMRSEGENFVFINSSKVTDHFAIIPTGETPNGLPEMEQKIYDLAKERFVQAWLKPYVWSEMEITLNSNSDLFRLKLKRNEDLGFRAIVKEEKKTKKKKKGDSGSEAGMTQDDKAGEGAAANEGDDITNLVEAFPEWNVGDNSPFDSVELQKKKKSKPKYYTEATLLAAMKTAGKQIENEELAEAMKDRGLGTPATQAGIIETLKKRGFIEAQKNYLVSTERGREVIALMDEKVKSPEMTGEWEYKLSQVEKGTLTPVEFRDGIVNYVKELFEHLREKYGSQFERETVTEAIACPKCGQPLEIAPWGYVCKNVECGFKTGHTIAGRMLSHSEMKQLLETRATPVLDGFISKKGTSFSAILKLDEEFKTIFEFPKRAFPKRDLPCPCCGDQLRFRKGTGEKGENLSAFVCPQCGYGIPQVFYQRKFTDEEVEGLLKNKFTPVLEPFKKNETTFRAALEIKENGKLAFNKLTVEVISQKN